MTLSARFFALSATASLTAACFAGQVFAEDVVTAESASAELRVPASIDYDALRERLAPSGLGLKPPSSASWSEIGLPFSLRYHTATRSVLVPIDEKSAWGVGITLNVSPGPGLEMSSVPALGLQLKRTPGLTLQRRF